LSIGSKGDRINARFVGIVVVVVVVLVTMNMWRYRQTIGISIVYSPKPNGPGALAEQVTYVGRKRKGVSEGLPRSERQ
jgi:hypothetical protein